jgi:cystathionine beta-lyase
MISHVEETAANDAAPTLAGQTLSHIAIRTDNAASTATASAYALSTLAIHADDHLSTHADVAAPIHVSTIFRFDQNPDQLVPAADVAIPPLRPTVQLHQVDHHPQHTVPALTPATHVYSRYSAPTFTRLETVLASLLHAPALTYTTGVSALHAIYTLLNPRRVALGHGYHGTVAVLALHTRLTGLQTLPLDCAASALQAGDVVHVETPTNPTGEAVDIAAYARKAHARGAYLVVDATFGPPGLQEPFGLGADVVMHSATKYLGGHSDMLGGVVATRRPDWLRGLVADRAVLGFVMGSLEAWLGLRSVRTLELRVRAQSAGAGALVAWLDACVRGDGDDAVGRVVERVRHASLQAGDMAWLRAQMPHGFGPVFGLRMRSERLARRLPSKLALFAHATSLGGVESLIEWRAMTDPTADCRLVRVSVGVERWEDLRADLLRGFRALVEEGGMWRWKRGWKGRGMAEKGWLRFDASRCA